MTERRRESENASDLLGIRGRITYPKRAAKALAERLRLAQADIVVFTDDDCETPENWAATITGILANQRTAAIAFCRIVAPPCDWTAGYVPTYDIPHSRLIRSLLGLCSGHGMGAGMAVRRSVVLQLGGFDEAVGPGCPFPSGDDWDIAHRVLLNGWHVYETADIAVLHHGFRAMSEGREHMRRDWFAIGGVCAKPLRAGHLSAAVLAGWYFLGYGLYPMLRQIAPPPRGPVADRRLCPIRK